MEEELLGIFNKKGVRIGTAPRNEVHRLGYWHETFHCWFYHREGDTAYLYFQLRSRKKKDYPGLLDITAAGHILAHESVEDGVREVKEEIGIDVGINNLVPVGVIPYSVTKSNFIDNELAHCYLYESHHSFEEFVLQEEEVEGIVKINISDFRGLLVGNRPTVEAEGFKVNLNGERVPFTTVIKQAEFVPHENSYYKKIIEAILSR